MIALQAGKPFSDRNVSITFEDSPITEFCEGIMLAGFRSLHPANLSPLYLPLGRTTDQYQRSTQFTM